MVEEALDVMDPAVKAIEELEDMVKPKAKAKRKISRSSEIGDVIEERKAKVTKYPVGTRTVKEKINAASKAKVKKALATTVRTPKRAKIVEKQRASAKRPVVKGDLTMARTYQRREGVAQGTEIASGARQTVCTFPAKMFASIAKLANRDGVSFTEQVRRLCAKGLKA